MRMIDADGIGEEFREYRFDGGKYSGCSIGDLIDAQPTVNQWISCSERLPERGERVLLYDLDGDIYLGHLATGCNYYYADYCDDRIKNVLAWCELPEPYKEATK